MTQWQRDRSLGDGVYFFADHYVGLGPRIVILIVDTLVLSVMLLLLAIVWWIAFGNPNGTFSSVAIFAIWLYLVPLKRSRTRTIGFRVTRVRLVTLKGQRPSLFM